MRGNEDDIIKQRVDRFNSMKEHRSNFENHWEKVAQVATPLDRQFTTFFTPGEQKRELQYDSTAELSLNRASSFYDAITTPRNKRWHGLVSNYEELNRVQPVREYYDQVESALFRHRYGQGSGFPGQRYEQIRSLWSFGNGIIFTEEVTGRLRYRAVHLSKFYMDENPWGVVDTGYRVLSMTAKQIEQRFGEEMVPKGLRGQTAAVQ